MKNEPAVRLFIAARLPFDLTERLAAAQKLLAAAAVKCRLTRLEHLHLTLRFIGEVRAEMAECVRQWFLGLELPKLPVGSCVFDRYGSFPGKEGATVWAGLACSEGIRDLQRRIEQGLQSLGLPAESKPWVPHITLARRAQPEQSLSAMLSALPPGRSTVMLQEFVLFRSDFTQQGMRYTPLLIKKEIELN